MQRTVKASRRNWSRCSRSRVLVIVLQNALPCILMDVERDDDRIYNERHRAVSYHSVIRLVWTSAFNRVELSLVVLNNRSINYQVCHLRLQEITGTQNCWERLSKCPITNCKSFSELFVRILLHAKRWWISEWKKSCRKKRN